MIEVYKKEDYGTHAMIWTIEGYAQMTYLKPDTLFNRQEVFRLDVKKFRWPEFIYIEDETTSFQLPPVLKASILDDNRGEVLNYLEILIK